MIISKSRKIPGLAARKVSVSCLLQYPLESCCSELSELYHLELHELCVGVRKASHIVVLMQFNPSLWSVLFLTTSPEVFILVATVSCSLRKRCSILTCPFLILVLEIEQYNRIHLYLFSVDCGCLHHK